MRGAVLNTNTIILLVVALLALAYFGVLKFPGASGGSGESESGTGVVLATSQSLYVNPLNYAQSGVAVAANSNVYNADGSLIKSQLASGTAQTVPANKRLRVFTNASGYFSSEDFVDTGTSPTVLLSPKLADDTTATVTIYNAGTYTTNAFAAKQAYSASDQKTLRVDVTGATDKFLTNPTVNKIRFALLLPTPTEWSYSSTADTYVEFNNQKCPTVSAPVTGANRQIAWECDMPNGGTGTSPYSYFLTMKASASGGNEQNLTLSIWGVGKYLNTLTGVTGIGAEDNIGSKLHTETNATIFIS
jgi:hypothetical protein